MRIGIVLHPYDEEKPSGLGRFIYELSSAMITNDSQNEYLVYVKGEPRTRPVFQGRHWKVRTGGSGLLWLDLLLSKNERSDIYLFNTPSMPLFFRPRRSVVIALDFAYKKIPAHSLFGWFKNQILFLYHARSLSRATHIIATSQATRNDLLRMFRIPPEKITVIYPGFSRICNLSQKEITVPSKYFFYIGAIKERKNIMNLVKAFMLFKEMTNFSHKLLIAGNNSGAYYDKIQAYLKEKGGMGDVIFLGYITDEEANFVHRRADAFVFVTLIEGSFGMPVLEAMDCGTPVITSDTETSLELKETESALLVDPENVADIASGMKRVASDAAFRKKLSQNGKAFSQNISWENMARDILSLATKIALN